MCYLSLLFSAVVPRYLTSEIEDPFVFDAYPRHAKKIHHVIEYNSYWVLQFV